MGTTSARAVGRAVRVPTLVVAAAAGALALAPAVAAHADTASPQSPPVTAAPATAPPTAAGVVVDGAAAAVAGAGQSQQGQSQQGQSRQGQSRQEVDVLPLDLDAQPARAGSVALPWVGGVLLVGVMAGAVRAYTRSPQRRALRETRAVGGARVPAGGPHGSDGRVA